MKFQKNITFFGLMLTAIGGIVGSGWLFGPFYAAKIAGPAAILSWLIGGCLMMVIALLFSELASMFPIAGGIVRYAHFSHGTLVSFTIAWISWLAFVTVAPIETMALLQYSSNYIPGLAHTVKGTITLTHAGVGFAATVMFLMCALNMFGVKFFSKTNNTLVIWKLIIPIITIFILFSHKFHGQNFTHYAGFMPYGIKGVLAALPTAGVIFSFIGYGAAIQMAAEAKNPRKVLPAAIMIALITCIVLYVALEAAFVGAVNPSSLAHGWSKMQFIGDAGPIAGIIAGFGLLWFVKILYFDAIISPFGTAYIYTASTARVSYAMSQNGYMPTVNQKLNKHGSPAVALLINFAVGMLFFLPFSGWQAMVSFLVSCFVLAYIVAPIACVVFRRTMPDAKRAFKVPKIKVTGTLGFYICNLIIYWTGWTTIWRMLLLMAIGYCFLVVYSLFKKNIVSKKDWKRAIWLIPYFVGMGAISYLGSFGGINIIPFGWDMLAILGLSCVTFYWAVKAGYKCAPPANAQAMDAR